MLDPNHVNVNAIIAAVGKEEEPRNEVMSNDFDVTIEIVTLLHHF